MLHPSRMRFSGPASRTAILVMSLLWGCLFELQAHASESEARTLPDFPALISLHALPLTAVASESDARTFFLRLLAPSLHMEDLARTFETPVSPALATELQVADLTLTVHQLIRSLAIWQFASSIPVLLSDRPVAFLRDGRGDDRPHLVWLLQSQPLLPWQQPLLQLVESLAAPEWTQRPLDPPFPLTVQTLEQAKRLEVAAIQSAYQAWDYLRNWKTRVRDNRGQARLCGSWQWIIHSHQHHQEQKLALRFPPVSISPGAVPGLIEMSVLGDSVYLRWENEGRVQEDSLQLSKESTRLEGTFVNSQGGIGAISAKKITSCRAEPKS